MKKFLVFLVALIATVCIGVTFYQFAKNDEVITVNTATIYVNFGDKLSLDDIGFSRKEASKSTTFDFNAGGDEVTSIIKFDQATQCYIPTSKGGATTIKISTSNRKFKTLTVDVYVGVGSEENPYYISNEKQLFQVTNKYVSEDACYKLVNNIEIKEAHTPIGLIDGQNNEFKGTFDGGYNTISNLKIESCQFGGLFGIIGAAGTVKNLSIVNAEIDGSFSSVGAVAGKCYGSIDKIIVENPDINNALGNGYTGGVVGRLETDPSALNSASMFRTGAYITEENLSINANGVLGGLAGVASGAKIHACYTSLSLKNISNNLTGGLVGEFGVDSNAYIRESYSVSKIEAKGTTGNIAGDVNINSGVDVTTLDTNLIFVGLYFNKSINSYKGLGEDTFNLGEYTSFAVKGKTTDELKNKNTYVYYITNKSNIVYWDKVWNCVDGQYPTLVFANMFKDVEINDGDSSNIEDDFDDTTTTPEIEDPSVTDPESSSSNTAIITNKEELLSHFQTGAKVTGKFVINANIDLGGANWTPVDFSGTLNGNHYTISNFTVTYKDKTVNNDYRGVFYRLSSSTIKNITFSNVKFLNQTSDGVGVVAGYIGADVRLANINIQNSTVTTSASYAGGVVGVINGLSRLENITVTNTSVTTALRTGGIAGRVSASGTLINCNVVSASSIISGVDVAGGIAATNYGTIDNCYVKGTITSYISSGMGCFGGIVGTNYKTIKNSTCWATINVTNTHSTAIYQVGGIASTNSGSIEYCGIYSSEISAKNSTSKVYIGGLTAHNEGTIAYCVADVDNIGSVSPNLYVAGLTTINFGGRITGCFAFGNLSGYLVAGLAISNDNNAIIDGCMTGKSTEDGMIDENDKLSERAKYKGYKTSTFAYRVTSGTISNCLVSASLECQSNDGWVAGFVGFMSYTKGTKDQPAKYGILESCIANISMENSTVGSIYADIASGDLLKKDRCSGTITNCVISNELSSRYYQSQRDKKWFSDETHAPGSGSNYIIKSVKDMTNISTFTQAGESNFDITTNAYFDPFAGTFDYKWVKASEYRIPVPGAIFIVFGENIFD